MQIFRSLEEFPSDFGPTVLSVGNFDGVHRAHQNVLSAVVRRAKELNSRSMVVTFDPHPTRVLRPDLAPKLITLGEDAGFAVISYPELRLRGESVSSSRIRDLVQKGNVSRARALLGRAFSFTAHPAKGRGYGKQYAVPTVNLSAYDELVPGNGVYITQTRIGKETFDSVTNVGNRPTFGADSFAIESHLLNFHPIDLTEDTSVETCFLLRLRDEIKFSSVEALRAQIGKDVSRAQRYFRLL